MTTLQTLPREVLTERLRGKGVAIRCGPLVIRIGTTLPELVDSIRLLYDDYPISDEEVADFEARVEMIPSWRRPFRRAATAIVDGRAAFAPFRRPQALAMFEWLMNACTFDRPNQYLMLHAAVVERCGHGLIISGQPGAGKSTLAASLAFRGWRLFSDEVAMIPPGTRTLLPLPRPIGLKNESIDIIRRDASSAVIGPSIADTRKGTVAHVRPPRESLLRADEPAVATWIVFPRFIAGTTVDVRAISRADALMRLADESFNYSLLGAAGFRSLATIVDGCSCFSMTYGSLADALACVGQVTGTAETPVG
jgi:HprK-related kinase A